MDLENAELDPQTWVHGYVQGNKKAAERLAEHLLATLQRRIKRLGVPTQDVDDISQSCAVEILSRIDEFDSSKGHLDAWINGFALNAVRMHRRSMGTKRTQNLSMEEYPNLGYEVANATSRKDVLARALQSIDIIDRELLHLRFAMNLSSTEIGEISNMNSAQARKRISRAVERLRRDPLMRQLLSN